MWRRRIFKGLRFRLALSYVVFFAILLTGFGFVLRSMLRSVIETTVEGLLDEEWAASKGFLRIDAKYEQTCNGYFSFGRHQIRIDK